MRKIYLLLLVCFIFPFCLKAVVITPEQALKRAGKSGVTATRGVSQSSVKLVYTARTQTDTPAVYVFDNADAKGFMLLSADDMAIPVLGYTDEGTFDTNNIPPQLQYWLSEYARQIEYASQHGVKEQDPLRTRALGGAIAPMLRTKWNQDTPYNNLCPPDGTKLSMTGCVATAMAQVMNYWKYPASGTGSISYEAKKIGTTLSMDFSTVSFDWSNMLDSYSESYTDAQATAVATLMKACGYSVEMNYGANESGAVSSNIARALVEHFGYNPNITFQQRDYYAGSQWNEMVYNELKAGRPVLYAGVSLTGAHQFVCDGYDGNGYFHFNWGWGGTSDGYYALDALSPTSQGIGGSSGGYNYGQSIICGVQKETSTGDYAGFLLEGGMQPSRNGLQVIVKLTEGAWILNSTYKTISGTFGFIIEPVGGGTKYFKESNWSPELGPGLGFRGYKDDGTPNVSFSFYFPNDSGMSNGSYKVTLACKYKDTDEWVPVPASTGYSNYFIVNKSGGTISIVNQGVKKFSVTGDVLSEIFLGLPATFTVTVKNNTDMEMTQGVYPGLMKGNNLYYAAEGVTLTLKPGEEVTRQWTSPFNLMGNNTDIASDTPFTMVFYDPGTGFVYDWQKSVTMKVNSGTTSVEVSNFRIDGSLTKRVLCNDNKLYGANGYLVPDMSKIQFSYTLKNTGTAYFGSPVYIFIFPFNKDASSLLQWGIIDEGNLIAPGTNSAQVRVYNFTGGEKGKSYFASLYYYKDNKWVPIKNDANNYQVVFELDTSGVADVASDDASFSLTYDKSSKIVNVLSKERLSEVKVYSLQGGNAAADVRYAGNSATVSVETLSPGVYMVVATDSNGTRKALKLIL